MLWRIWNTQFLPALLHQPSTRRDALLSVACTALSRSLVSVTEGGEFIIIAAVLNSSVRSFVCFHATETGTPEGFRMRPTQFISIWQSGCGSALVLVRLLVRGINGLKCEEASRILRERSTSFLTDEFVALKARPLKIQE